MKPIEMQALRDASAKYEDLSHQVDQKAAEHRNNAAKRTTDLEGAQAGFSKAQIEMRKGPILSEIDRQKNQIKLDDAREHVASLLRSNKFHEQAEAAESRVLELRRDRGHLAVGYKVHIDAIAIRGRTFQGHIKDIGGSTGGMPWDRHFESFGKTSISSRATEGVGPERPGKTPHRQNRARLPTGSM